VVEQESKAVLFPRRGSRAFVLVAACASLMFPDGSTSAQAVSPSSAIRVSMNSATQRVSIHAREVRLVDLLREIGRVTGLEIGSIRAELASDRASLELSDAPLVDALAGLLKSYNTAFVSAAENAERTRRPMPGKLLVISRKDGPGAITAMAPPSSVSPVERLFVDPSTAATVAHELRQPGSEALRTEVEERLLGVLKERDRMFVDVAIDTLKDLAPERALSILLEWLRHDTARVRRAGVVALGRLGHEDAIAPLLVVLDTDATARQAAASSLALIGGRATDALLRAYVAGDNATRYPIAVAIASHGDSSSQRALATLVQAGHTSRPPAAHEVASRRTNRNTD
jgi:hypothetical protein